MTTFENKLQPETSCGPAGVCRLCTNTKEDCPLLSDDAIEHVRELTVYRFSVFDDRPLE